MMFERVPLWNALLKKRVDSFSQTTLTMTKLSQVTATCYTLPNARVKLWSKVKGELSEFNMFQGLKQFLIKLLYR